MSLQELVHAKSADADDAVEKEAAKGYSIAFVGIEQPISATANQFDDRLQRLVEAFDGPFAIVLNGARSAAKPGAPLNILVPTGGTPDARLAIEIALALAKASDGVLTALHVFDPQDDTELLRGRARRQGLSVLVDARRLGKRSGVPVKGITRDPFKAGGGDPARRASGPLRSGRGWHFVAARRDEIPRSAQLGPSSRAAIPRIADRPVVGLPRQGDRRSPRSRRPMEAKGRPRWSGATDDLHNRHHL